MKITETTRNKIVLSGSAPEFSSLARSIKKLKANKETSIKTDDNQLIVLTCTKSTTKISAYKNIRIEVTEMTKNQLFNLISMPAKTTKGSQFTLTSADHPELLSKDSIDLVLNLL